MCDSIPNNKKYQGKFVATASFTSKKVVASGRNPETVRERAVGKGYTSPVVVFIPDRKMYYIF